MFAGRKRELELLTRCFVDRKSHLTILYGRRRIGKTALIEKYCSGKRAFNYIALQTNRKEQIKNFLSEFSKFVADPLVATAPYSSWRDVFNLVPDRLSQGKIVFVLDEFQWMCKTDTSLLSVIQLIWDQHWQNKNRIHLILCGSSISFMLDEVLSHKSPLFGRRTESIELEQLSPHEAKEMLGIKDNYETALYLMSFGAVPAYLLLIDKKLSFKQNMTRLAFCSNGYFVDELKYILSDQLKQPTIYYKILHTLCLKARSLAQLSKIIGISTGSLTYYMDRLKAIQIVEEYRPILLSDTSKTVQFKIVDEYVRFYFVFIKPKLQIIQKNTDENSFDRIVSNKWDSYCGVAFERFCFRNMNAVIKKLGIETSFVKFGPYWHKRSARNKRGVQIDIVIERKDRMSMIVECKWSLDKTGYSTLQELDEKCSSYPNTHKHRLRKVLITSSGVTNNLVDHPELDVMTLDDFF